MMDRDRALQLLMGRYRHDEAMHLFSEYCVLLDGGIQALEARHTPSRLRHLHRVFSGTQAPAAPGSGLLKRVTGLLGPRTTPAPASAAQTPAGALGHDPEQLLQSLVAPTFSLHLGAGLAEHPAVGGALTALQDAIAHARLRVAEDLGFAFPALAVRPAAGLPPLTYAIKIHGATVAEGALQPDLLAVVGQDLPGGWKTEPHPARDTRLAWIATSAGQAWEGETQSPAMLVAEHVEAVARRRPAQLFNNAALEQILKAHEGELGKDTLAELFGRFMSLTEFRLLMQAMLQRGWSVAGLPAIVDLLLNHFINDMARRPITMEDSWKLSSHLPMCGTEELLQVVAQGLGLPGASGTTAGVAAALERAVRDGGPRDPGTGKGAL